MIRLMSLSKDFAGPNGSIEALRDIDLWIERGDIFGVIGRSGAGKSTLLRCMNLLERPSRGRVEVAGTDLMALTPRDLRAARRGIGMIFQHFNLLGSRTVFGNVALPLELSGASRAQIDAAVLPLLDFVGLGTTRDRFPAQLSGGQKQRVGIARALATNPAVLLCDEPTSALDPQTTESILALLGEVNATFGVTIVLVTHEMHALKRIARNLAVMDGGVIVERGAVRDIFRAPTAAATRSLLGGPTIAELSELVGAAIGPTDVGGAALWRLTFSEAAAEESAIAQLVRRFSLDLTIISGTIERVGGAPLGTLILSIEASHEQTTAALAWLSSIAIGVEVIGYVGSLRARR